jgi:hypothetical protein
MAGSSVATRPTTLSNRLGPGHQHAIDAAKPTAITLRASIVARVGWANGNTELMLTYGDLVEIPSAFCHEAARSLH